jgi:hypothetical protein
MIKGSVPECGSSELNKESGEMVHLNSFSRSAMVRSKFLKFIHIHPNFPLYATLHYITRIRVIIVAQSAQLRPTWKTDVFRRNKAVRIFQCILGFQSTQRVDFLDSLPRAISVLVTRYSSSTDSLERVPSPAHVGKLAVGHDAVGVALITPVQAAGSHPPLPAPKSQSSSMQMQFPTG